MRYFYTQSIYLKKIHPHENGGATTNYVTYSRHQPKRYGVSSPKSPAKDIKDFLRGTPMFPSTAFYSEEHDQPHLFDEKVFFLDLDCYSAMLDRKILP